MHSFLAACLDDPLARLAHAHQLDENSNSQSPKVVAAACVAVRKSIRRPSPMRLTNPAAPNNVAPGPPCLQTDIDDVLLLDASTDEDRASSRSAGSVLSMSGAAIATTPTITADFELSVLERFDQLLASLGTGGHSSSGINASLSLFSFCFDAHKLLFRAPLTTKTNRRVVRWSLLVGNVSTVSCFDPLRCKGGSSTASSSTINGGQEPTDKAATAAAKAAASHAITASVNRRQKIYGTDRLFSSSSSSTLT